MRKSLILFYIALCFACLPLCFSQDVTPTPPERPMTFDDMMKMKRLGETAVSPDGKWLAYAVTSVNLDQNTRTTELWVQKIEGPASGESAPMKVAVARPGDNGIQFAPDGKRILFMSGRAIGQQVWIADFDPETGATSNAKKLTNMATEADNARWSPDGQSVVFTSGVYPDCPPITNEDFDTGDRCNSDHDAAIANSKVKAQIFTHSLYRHWNHFTGDKRSHLFLIAVENGAVRDLTPNETHDVPPYSVEGGGGFAIAPDAKELAFTEKLVEDEAITTNADIFTLDLTDPAAKPVKVSTSRGGDWSPAYSPDGKYLAWRSQERDGHESDKFRLVLYDREKGSKSASQQVGESAIRDLLPKFDNWVDEFAWAPNSKSIYLVAGNAGTEPVYEANLDGKLTQIAASADFSGLNPLSNGAGIVLTKVTVSLPGEVVRLSFEGLVNQTARLDDSILNVKIATEFAVSHLNNELLSQLDLPKMESFWFTAKDSTKVQGFLVRPPGFDALKKYPLKFLIHGGPESNWGDAWSYRWNAELFAANGYVVIMINPRGSTGYGQAFIDAINGDWGGKPFTDLMTGLDYAEQHYPFIDKSRECALGASYGGYMANWILGHSDRFKCIVTHDGMFNPESAYGATEEQWFNEWEFKGAPWDYYGKPDCAGVPTDRSSSVGCVENPYRKWSPAMSAKNFKTPTLVIHSQLDYRLDVSEGFQLFDTLQRLGVPSKMLYFPDEGHWVLKPQNSQLWYKTVNDWVDKWTANAASSH